MVLYHKPCRDGNCKMVVSQGVEPHLSEEHWFTASLPSVDIYLTMAPGAGLEPATAALTVRNSTIELSRNLKISQSMLRYPSNPLNERRRARKKDVRIFYRVGFDPTSPQLPPGRAIGFSLPSIFHLLPIFKEQCGIHHGA